MMHNKYKIWNDSKQNERYQSKQNFMITQYRSLIIPEHFHIKTVETYGCILPIELESLQHHVLYNDQLKQIIVDTLKLSFIYDQVILALKKQNPKIHQYIIKDILRVLIRGEFYQFMNNVQNPLKILVNNRTTEGNIKILISTLLLYSLHKMTLKNIETILLIFTLQASFHDHEKLTIPLDTFNIIKILKKLDRVIKPIDFKIWQQNFKKSSDFHGEVEAHHFIYLCSISEIKFTGNNIFKLNFNGLNKNVNNSGKGIQNQQKQIVNDFKQEKQRNIVRGLSFAENKKRYSSCTKQLLKEIRIRDPSRGKRPNTSLLRRNMSQHISFPLKPNQNARKTVYQSQNMFLFKQQKANFNTAKQRFSKYMSGNNRKQYHLKLKIKKTNNKQLMNKMTYASKNAWNNQIC